MRIVESVAKAKSAGAIRAVGVVCMAVAWMLASMPAQAQNGAAQNESAQGSAGQNEPVQERLGVSRPDPSVITATPYSDSTAASGNTSSNPPATQPVKPSAAVHAATATTSTAAAASAKTGASADSLDNSYTATGVVISTAGNGDAAPDSNGTAAFDPDASIVTAATAGRAQRQLLSRAQGAAAAGDPDAGIVTAATAGEAQRQLLSGAETATAGDPDAGIVMRVPAPPGEVPDGTLVKVKLGEDLSTLTTKPGTSFTAEVSEPVMRDGQVVVPVGSLLTGRVTWVRGGKRFGGAAGIHLETSTVTLPDGSQYALRARAIDTYGWDDTRVDSEGTILRKEHAKGTAESIGLATGGAMAAGAEIGGVPGALIGAGVGAGVGTAVWLRQDRQAELPKDMGIVFSLTEPMRVTPLSASARLTRPGADGD